MKITPDMIRELESVRHAHEGVLRPSDALDFAKDESTHLHRALAERNLWNDDEAAQYGRLQFMRSLIMRVRVTVKMPSGKPHKIRAYVSPMEGRRDRGGYISVKEVLQDDAKKAQLLETALKELQSFQRKYQDVQELFGIFEEIDSVSEALESAA